MSEIALTTIAAIRMQARETPDALAFEFEGEETVWGEFERDARRLACGLRSLGVRPGDRCAIVLPTSLDLIRVLLAVQWLRACPAIINPDLPRELLARRIARIGFSWVVVPDGVPIEETEGGPRIVTRSNAEAVADGELDEEPGSDDVAFLQITSGTTGDPRVAVILQRNLNAYMRSVWAELTPTEVIVSWVPLHHDMGLVIGAFASIFTGRPSHLLAPSLRNLRKWLETIDRVKGSYTCGPDFAYRVAALIVDPRGLDLGSLRVAVSGGEPVKLGTIRLFEEKFGLDGVVRPGYGLAETTLGVARMLPGEPLDTLDGQVTCGGLRSGLEVRIVDADGRELAPREKGEILVRGEQVFSGYLDDDEATRAVVRDGWLHTGDLGALDEQGRLYVFGRIRAMIKRAGSTIAPREIEEIVDEIPGVRGSSAVGVPTDEGTERVVIVVEQSGNGEDADEIRRSIAERVRAAMGFPPDEIIVAPPRTIPRTASGKIQYGELRELVMSGRLE